LNKLNKKNQIITFTGKKINKMHKESTSLSNQKIPTAFNFIKCFMGKFFMGLHPVLDQGLGGNRTETGSWDWY